jgi:RNA polymerase sigma-70 factor (ECF subfamily)
MAQYTELLKDMDIPPSGGLRYTSPDSSKKEIPEDTLRALRDGDSDAYDTVFKAYHAPIKLFLEKMIHNEAAAQDLTQEVFVNLWTKRDMVDPSKNIKGFLYTTVKYYMLRYLKHQKVVDRWEQYKISDQLDLSDSPHDIAVAKEMSLLIELSVARMPGQQARVMRMRYFEGMSNDAIAEELGISGETVKVYLKRGRAELHKVLTMFIALFVTAS